MTILELKHYLIFRIQCMYLNADWMKERTGLVNSKTVNRK